MAAALTCQNNWHILTYRFGGRIVTAVSALKIADRWLKARFVERHVTVNDMGTRYTERQQKLQVFIDLLDQWVDLDNVAKVQDLRS